MRATIIVTKVTIYLPSCGSIQYNRIIHAKKDIYQSVIDQEKLKVHIARELHESAQAGPSCLRGQTLRNNMTAMRMLIKLTKLRYARVHASRVGNQYIMSHVVISLLVTFWLAAMATARPVRTQGASKNRIPILCCCVSFSDEILQIIQFYARILQLRKNRQTAMCCYKWQV